MFDLKSKTLKINKKGEVYYITFPHLEKYDFVKHGFSTRLGGVSKGEFSSMSFSFKRDNKEDVIENCKIFCNAIGVEYKNLVCSEQTHTTNIRCVTEEDKGKCIFKEKDYTDIDGLITNVPNIPLLTVAADCTLLFFLDPVAKVVGVAHSGWKGTVNKIGEKMVDIFKQKYNSNPENILVGISPSIGQCCFEVESDVATLVEKIQPSMNEFIDDKKNGKYMIDTWGINHKILTSTGIKPENIVTTDICTKCNPDIFFSHRAQGEKRGLLGGIIELSQNIIT